MTPATRTRLRRIARLLVLPIFIALVTTAAFGTADQYVFCLLVGCCFVVVADMYLQDPED